MATTYADLRKIALDTIAVMAEELNEIADAEGFGDDKRRENAHLAVLQSPLEVTYRAEGTDPAKLEASEIVILLSTGGPAVRLVAGCDAAGLFDGDVHIETQDWGTSWTRINLSESETNTLDAWASVLLPS